MRKVAVTVQGILGELRKQAAAPAPDRNDISEGAAVSSVLAGLTADDLNRVADAIEQQGEVAKVAAAVVSAPASGDAEADGLSAYLELRKIATRRAFEKLGIRRPSPADNDLALLGAIFGGENGAEKLAEAAAHYVMAQIDPSRREGGEA